MKLKKVIRLIGIVFVLIVFSVIISCSPAVSGNYAVTINEKDQVTQTYYSKNASYSFRAFLENPEENVKASRAARAARMAQGEDETLTENDMFAEMWESLTDEEKSMMQENAGSIEMVQDFTLAVDAESETGRAALLGDSSSLQALTELYRYNARLEDVFANLTLPISFVEETVPEEIDV
ncbi:MAG: hypothetical protein IJ191_00315, partial [Treponema sp.]|nr:hypothetical protein [Treponema sp.]